jgi:hypothetical protein
LLERAYDKVYWLMAIGPRWKYGEKDGIGQSFRPLTPWKDANMFDDLKRLRILVDHLSSQVSVEQLLRCMPFTDIECPIASRAFK